MKAFYLEQGVGRMKSLLTSILFLFLMPFISQAATDKKQDTVTKQRTIETSETVSSVTISHIKKMVSHSETVPTYYTETVRNVSSDKPAFVNVGVYRLNNPGGDQEDLTPVELSDDADVYAMPNQVVVPAGGVRTVRVYLTEKMKRDRDRYFRIRFSPSTLPVDEEGSPTKKSAKSSLFIGMGAGQLLMVNKSNPLFDTKVYVQKTLAGTSELVLHNKGDSFIRLEKMKTCYTKDQKKPCQYTSGKHINAGAIKKLPIHKSISTIVVELIEGDKTRTVEYDYQSPETVKII